MTFQELVDDFITGATSGVSSGGANLKIIGDKLIHFNTIIAERYDNKIILNNTRYSVQTGRLQKIIESTVKADQIIIVTKIPMDFRGSLVDEIHNHEV